MGADLEVALPRSLEATGITASRPYPFPDEAEAFAEVYHSTKKAVGSPDSGSGDNTL